MHFAHMRMYNGRNITLRTTRRLANPLSTRRSLSEDRVTHPRVAEGHLSPSRTRTLARWGFAKKKVKGTSWDARSPDNETRFFNSLRM